LNRTAALWEANEFSRTSDLLRWKLPRWLPRWQLFIRFS